jgi:hypothetical protein
MPENQTQPNRAGADDPSGAAGIRDEAAEPRSFAADRPGETQTVRAPQDPEAGADEQDPGRTQGMELGEGYAGTTYEPSTVQVNRARMQGDGVGQKDLDYQRDPTGDKSYEEF